MKIKELILGLILSLGAAGCSYQKFLNEGYNLNDSVYFAENKADIAKIKPYKKLYDRYGLHALSLMMLSDSNFPVDYAESCLSKGYSPEDIALIKATGLDIERGAPYKSKGATLMGISLFLENHVPLEYYLKKKSEFREYELARIYCSSLRDARVSSKLTRDVYGRNVEYCDFGKLEILSGEEVEVPIDLAARISFFVPKIADRGSFYQNVMAEAKKLELDEEKMKKMSPKEAIMAAVKITCRRMSYMDVDNDRSFTEIFGKHLSHDRYFELGIGDCDKYAALTTAIFDIIREKNSKLKNVYLTFATEGNPRLHAWNSVIVLEKDRIKCCHIDPTFFGNTGKLEADEWHLDKKNFVNKFFAGLPNR